MERVEYNKKKKWEEAKKQNHNNKQVKELLKRV